MATLARTLVSMGRKAQPVHVAHWLTVCTANVLTRAMMERRLFSLDHRSDVAMAREFKEMGQELTQLAGVFMIGDYVPALGWWDSKGVVEKMKALGERQDVFLDRIMEEHKELSSGDSDSKSNGEHKDMMSVLTGLKDNADGEGAKLNDTEIKAVMLDLFTAGTDTSSSTLEWALAELTLQPDLLKKAQHELDMVMGRHRLISETDLPHLPLLQAIVKETFHLHPSTPFPPTHRFQRLRDQWLPCTQGLHPSRQCVGHRP